MPADAPNGASASDADELVRQLLAVGSEARVDYKHAMAFPSGEERAKLAKHIIALCNREDGGYLLVGVDDQTHRPLTLTQEQLNSWDAATVNQALASYAAPPPVVQIFRGRTATGEELVAIRVVPFKDQPLVCIKTMNNPAGKSITRAGALYIRTETTQSKEVTTEAEMRELLGRAYVRKGQALLAQIKALIDAHWPGNEPADAAVYTADISSDLAAMDLPK